MPHQNRPTPATLCHWSNCHSIRVLVWFGGILIGQPAPTGEGYPYLTTHRHSPCHKIIITIHEEKWIRHHPDPRLPTHLRYSHYLCSYAQGDFNIQRRQTPSVFVLQFYHPVWVFVKHHPEVILTILRCEKDLVAFVLLDGALCIVAHKIGKAILCLSRNRCDECGVHESRCRCMQSRWWCRSRRDHVCH